MLILDYCLLYLNRNDISADPIHHIGCGLNAVSADSIHLIWCCLNYVSADSIHCIGCGLNDICAVYFIRPIIYGNLLIVVISLRAFRKCINNTKFNVKIVNIRYLLSLLLVH